MNTAEIEKPTLLPPSLDASLTAHFQVALALQNEGKLCEASEEIKRALQVKPDSPEAHFNLANIVRDAGEIELAAQGFRTAIEFAKVKKHVYPDALINLADALRRLGRHDEALVPIGEALKLQPGRVEAHIGHALILQAQGKQAAAIERLHKAVNAAPDSAAAYFQLGLACHWASRGEEALAAYDRVIALAPEFIPAKIERARTLFRLGRLEEGFAAFEARPRNLPQGLGPLWDGKARLKGKAVLVYCEPGFIDELQFARYAPVLAKQGANVTVMVQEPLRQLFESLSGIKKVVALDGPMPPHDAAVALMSLPHLLRTTGDTIPTDMPYLSADTTLAAAWAKTLDAVKGLKIGVAWIGGQDNGAMQGSALTPEALQSLASLRNVTLVSLQQQRHDEQIPGLLSPGLLGDFATAAALIAAVDLVISVDAAVAHLAAAMGKPVWLLLPVVPDAPWSLSGDTHSWYPTMRVFRQRRKNGWDEVLKRVAKELGKDNPVQ